MFFVRSDACCGPPASAALNLLKVADSAQGIVGRPAMPKLAWHIDEVARSSFQRSFSEKPLTRSKTEGGEQKRGRRRQGAGTCQQRQPYPWTRAADRKICGPVLGRPKIRRSPTM
eukprot:7448009-Pyramimonas_sp.AAC.1